MNTITKKVLRITVAAYLLASLAACTNTQGSPNMVDYSYVPATQAITTHTAPGIESF